MKCVGNGNMIEKHKDKDNDSVLFHQAMRGVKPLIYDKEPVRCPHKKSKTKKFQSNQNINYENELSEYYEPAEVIDDELFFVRSGIQRGILRKLKRRYSNIKIKLDLHGMTVTAARVAIVEFLHYCQHNNIKYACIIHGKGHDSHQKQGILKTKVNQWLRARQEVLAFCSAHHSDGGTGAVYILIKRLRQ